jgi:hypothetical protein
MTEPQAGEARIDSVHVHEIGQRLIDLGNTLVSAGHLTESEELRRRIREAEIAGIEEVDAAVDREIAAAVRRTLMELSVFRREYADWERLTVEYALGRVGLTQRQVASLLGVGLSTVNRWAQHPLRYPED